MKYFYLFIGFMLVLAATLYGLAWAMEYQREQHEVSDEIKNQMHRKVSEMHGWPVDA